MRLLLVSGLSGSGKTIALQTLEDLDFYCVDNLPVSLIPPLVRTVRERPGSTPPGIAIGIDVRNFHDDFAELPAVLDELAAFGTRIETVFLTADDVNLHRRYSETRRRHPLSTGEGPIDEAIERERLLLEPLAERADLTLDTSDLHVHQLRALIRARLGERPGEQVSLLFTSFGFKHGAPQDADYLFDVRCLPNPHWSPGLRPLTGLDAPVMDYLARQPEVNRMIDDLSHLLTTWIPVHIGSGRVYLTVACGCTGGRHRSVYITEALAGQFRAAGHHVVVRHRELM